MTNQKIKKFIIVKTGESEGYVTAGEVDDLVSYKPNTKELQNLVVEAWQGASGEFKIAFWNVYLFRRLRYWLNEANDNPVYALGGAFRRAMSCYNTTLMESLVGYNNDRAEPPREPLPTISLVCEAAAYAITDASVNEFISAMQYVEESLKASVLAQQYQPLTLEQHATLALVAYVINKEGGTHSPDPW